MNDKEINRVSVIGSGLMGHGIVLEFALAGYKVLMHSRSENSLKRGLQSIEESLARIQALGGISESDADLARSGVVTTTSMAVAADNADLVIEAVYEDLDLKRVVFGELDQLCPRHTILASNSSTFMPSMYASATGRQDRVVGAHFINPAFLIPLVEVVPSVKTSAATIQSIVRFLISVGKRPIVLKREIPGFVASRLQGALLREALWIVENGVAEAQDVDRAIKTSIGRRWSVAGVFEVLDIAGWDLMHSYAKSLFPHLASGPEVPRVLNERVERGELGLKTGKGFNEWTPKSANCLKQRIAAALIEIDRWS